MKAIILRMKHEIQNPKFKKEKQEFQIYLFRIFIDNMH